MEAPLSLVDPQAPTGISIVEHLQLDVGLGRPQADGLRSVRDALGVLEQPPHRPPRAALLRAPRRVLLPTRRLADRHS